MKTVNIHEAKNRCGEVRWHEQFWWRYEVIDELTASNLEDALLLENKLEEIAEKNWDRMYQMACGIVRSRLT